MFFRSRKRSAGAADGAVAEPPVESLEELLAEIERLRGTRIGDPDLDRRLLQARHRAGLAMIAQHPGQAQDPEPAPGRFADQTGVPEVDSDELSPALLRAAILARGCLLVRGLVRPEQAAEFRDTMDRAFAARAAATKGEPVPAGYFEEFVPDARYDLGLHRGMVSDSNGMWLADSPVVTADWFELLDRSGFLDLAAGYLGERPAISVNKSTLRRVRAEPDNDYSSSFWHQDGAFLGPVRALNLWLSLSHCGDVAPGLDLVPRRLDHIVSTGTDGAVFDWSVSQEVAEEAAGEGGTSRPRFAPGDALLFDELLLHGTALSAEMTERRYAVECWFFGPSAFPAEYPPLAS